MPTRQYATFEVADQLFGVEVETVQDVLSFSAYTGRRPLGRLGRRPGPGVGLARVGGGAAPGRGPPGWALPAGGSPADPGRVAARRGCPGTALAGGGVSRPAGADPARDRRPRGPGPG